MVGANAMLESYRAKEGVHEGEHVEGDKAGVCVVASAPGSPMQLVSSASLEEGRHTRHRKTARVRREFTHSRCRSAW